MNYLGTISYRSGTPGAKVDEGFCASLVAAWDFLCREYGRDVAETAHDVNQCTPRPNFYFLRGLSCWLPEAAHQIVTGFHGDWFIMLDTDHAFQNDALFEMVQTFEYEKLDVLSGFTQRRQPPYTPCIYRYNFDPEKGTEPIIPKGFDRHRLIPIDAAGCSSLMVRRQVVERMQNELKERPFQPRWKWQAKGRSGGLYESGPQETDPFHWEDISFFWRLRLLGIQAYCAPWIQFHHLETRVVTEAMIQEARPKEIPVE